MVPLDPTPQIKSIPELTDITPVAKIRETPVSIWYRARQERLDRDVLLKMRPIGGGGLPGGRAAETTGKGSGKPPRREEEPALTRAREEVVLLSKLHSDGIVAAFEANASGGWLYQIVELPPGSPLSQVFQERGREPWSPAEAIEITAGVLQAVDHAHRFGITLVRIHPEDIFLDPNGRAKIASLEWASGAGRSGVLPLDLNWIAPEVAGGQIPSPPADLYAVGLLLAWLLTGREPPASGLRRASDKAAEALRARSIREDLTSFVAKLLDAAPERRPPSGASALEEMGKIKEALERRRPPLHILVPAVLVLVLALGGSLALIISAIKSLGSGPVSSGGAGAAMELASEERAETSEPLEKEIEEGGVKVQKENLETARKDQPGVASTAIDPAVEKKLLEISQAWKSDPTSWAKAAAEAEAFRDGQDAPEARALIEKLISEIRADWQKQGKEALDAFTNQELPALLSKKDFLSAAAQVEGLSQRFPQEAEGISALRTKLQDARKEAVQAFQAQMDGLVLSGKLDEATRSVEEAKGHLLPPEDAGLQAFTRRIEAARKEREAAQERITGAIARARELLLQRRMGEAIQALEVEAPEDLAEPLVSLRGELELAGKAKRAIEAGLDRAIREKTEFLTRVPDSFGILEESPMNIFLDSRNETEVVAHRKGSTAKMRFDWSGLELQALEKLARKELSADSLHEGLVVLYLGFDLVDPAAALIQSNGFSTTVSAKYKDRILLVRKERFLQQAAALDRRKDELTSRGSGIREDWSWLRQSAENLILGYRKEAFFSEQRPKLEETFLAARIQELRTEAPDVFFHGKIQKIRGESAVEILYDFRNEEELRDWIKVGSKSVIKQDKESIRLKGAIRLQRGDPFQAPVRVAVRVPGGGHSHPTHLGIAVCSQESRAAPVTRAKSGEEKQVQKKSGEGTSSPAPAAQKEIQRKSDSAGPPSGSSSKVLPKKQGHAITFILGYSSPEGALNISRKLPLKVSTPADAVFVGSGALPQEKDVFWASPSGEAVGPLILQADLTDEEFSWKVNGKIVMRDRGRFSREKRGRLALEETPVKLRGSVTILAGGNEVAIQKIEVAGSLSEGWIEEQLNLLAQKSLENILPQVKAAPEKSSKKAN